MAESFISFKGVGTRQYATNRTNIVPTTQLPIGISLPMSFGSEDFLQMNKDLFVQIKQNFRNLLLTNFGERLVLFDYGANLKPLVSEYLNQETFDEEAMIRINTAVSKYMPFIQLEGFKSEVTKLLENGAGISSIGVVKITLQYSIPRVNISQSLLEVSIQAM
jgi:phage baseplate assembly protein W